MNSLLLSPWIKKWDPEKGWVGAVEPLQDPIDPVYSRPADQNNGVGSGDLPLKNDGLHLTREGQVILGKRFA